MTLALKSHELEELAGVLEEIGRALGGQSEERSLRWNDLLNFTDSEALVLGIRRLHAHNTTITDTVDQISSVARFLLSAAGLARVLEQHLWVVERWAGIAPEAIATLRYLTMMGDLLDFMCARQIGALCTPTAAPPVQALGDVADLPATAIHEFHHMNAPPLIRELVDANPDLILLEVGDGTFAAAFGDIDESAAVTTMVAGVGSSDPVHWQGNLDRARRIHQATGAATILWSGYTAPAGIPHAISGRSAEVAGRELRTFQEALATRRPDQRRVGLGYSYGSVVVGTAASESPDGFDAVILVGSPGAGVGHARDIHADVYAVTGTRDPIGLATTMVNGVHGRDPTSPWFGSEVWESDVTHSGYWDDPGFLDRVRDVVDGKAEQG